MEQKSEILHQFLSDVFGGILKREEDSLAAGDLSLREVQLIDAVCRTVDQGGDNRSTAIAAARRVAAGTLTSAVDLLVKKGYLVRLRDGKDRRVVRLMPTQQGRDASERHRAFHRRMTDSVLSVLTYQEVSALMRGMEKLTDFFRGGSQALANSTITVQTK